MRITAERVEEFSLEEQALGPIISGAEMRQEMKECSVSDSVAVPGPPLVITCGKSTILKASIIRISTTVRLNGKIWGQVIRQKICQRLAPDFTSESYCSADSDDRSF